MFRENILRKIIILCLLFGTWCVGAYAKDNVLTGLKVMPMPNNRVRFDFQFVDPIDQLPASFITQEPPRLVLDFVNTSNRLDSALQSKKMDVGSLTQYKIVTLGKRVRAVLDLTGTVSYSGEVSGHVYSLIISGKGEQLISPRKELFITNRPVNARFGITHIDFRGLEKQGGRVVIDLTDPGIPVDVVQTGKNVVINFMSTRLQPQLMKRYDVADFHSPVRSISAEQEGKSARITLMNDGDYGHFAYQVNKQFIIDVFPLSAEEIQQETSKAS